MKNFRLTFGMLACATLLSLAGCQNDTAEPTGEDSELAYETQEYQITEIGGLESPVIISTTDNTAFSTQTDQERTHRLSYILSRLNLSDAQKHAVRKFVAQHEECVVSHHAKIKQYHEELLKKANATREEYVKAFREGKITQAELEAKLAALKAKLQEELQHHDARLMHLRIMHQCRQQLFANIESVLGPEQLARFRRWRESL